MNFRKILKRISWVVLLSTVAVTLSLTYIVTLVRYAETETAELNRYRVSIAAMPEVANVQSVHRFNGLKSYIVAHILHENGEDFYFFIRDGSVQHFFPIPDLITIQTAHTLALQQIPGGNIHRTQVGILDDIPIFEVQIQFEGSVHYIVINAESHEIMMQFYT